MGASPPVLSGPGLRDGSRLRVGVWCVIQSPAGTATVLPDEGIGVFVYNLVGGLLAQDVPPEVVLVVRPEERDRVESFLRAPRPNLYVFPPRPPRGRWWKEPGRLLRGWVRVSDGLRRRLDALRRRSREARRSARARALAPLRLLLGRAVEGRFGIAALAALALPLLLLAWALYLPYRLAPALLSFLAAPLIWADRAARHLAGHPRLAAPVEPEPDPVRLAAEAGCDVWVIPSIHCNTPGELPSVLFVHDLVTSHFPEMYPREFVDRVSRIAARRAARATLVACMSGFIRDTDLLGVLGLPAARVRTVPSATPVDFPPLTDVEARALVPGSLRRPYLLFPAAFRPHKNHRGLVKALRRLRDVYAVSDFDLVFTGVAAGQLPAELRRLVDAYGLGDRVHAVGNVDRKTLAALYRRAFATLVPSLYEQASYQIAEALHTGCPVACSRIPPFLEQCAPLGDAMVYFDPEDSDSIARAVLQLRENRSAVRHRQLHASRALTPRTWRDAAGEWLEVFREAAELAARREAGDARGVPALPGDVPPGEREPLEAFLFLPTAYRGGVWESVRNLVTALAEVNRQRRLLKLVLGVHEDQADTALLGRDAPDVRLERLVHEEYTPDEGRDVLGNAYRQRDPAGVQRFCGYRGRDYPAARADAWLALLDRFSLPLLPVRPYAVWVYDMIQRHAPECFGDVFFSHWVRAGMVPTLRHAAAIITTSQSTARDVADFYGLQTGKVRTVPVACEPHRRFAGFTPRTVPLAREPFLLYPANAGGHKGAGVVLRAYARLRERLGGRTPLLVQCGTESDAFSRRYQPRPADPPHWAATRALVADLELEEGRDVVFTGFVEDDQLLDLYQRCGAVINAAKYDNGSYSLVEGRYFGRPLVSAEYPGATDLCARFGLPARFFPVDDDAALAARLEEVLREPTLSGSALEAVRRGLAGPEFSLRRHAERVYDLLVDLAREGRRQRLARGGGSPPRSAAAA